jgi:hypothetical protein
MKKFTSLIIIIFISLCCFGANPANTPKYKLKTPTGNPAEFYESWGYVLTNRINEYNKDMPLTDVCFFSADVNTYGDLVDIPDPTKVDIGNARSHLVVVCSGRALTHFSIDPGYSIRKKLINDIVKAAKPFDGVNIDFENVPEKDKAHFITFLADLRYKLKGKIFSVCVPARTSEGTYPYKEISKYCDRVFVMVYDEHWSGSRPGPIASPAWSKKICDYAVKTIPAEKLIMGVPFYGRTWASKSHSGAWYFSGANRVMTENNVKDVTYENDIPKFSYSVNIDVTGYFNDTYSVLNLCRIYEEAKVRNIGFWRVGQEDPDFWQWIKIKEK